MSKELKVGFLALIAAVVIYFGFNYLKGDPLFSSVNTYYLTYRDINGLTISNPVVVNGLSVGKVKNLQLLQDGKLNKIKVTIQVEDKIEIGDSTLAILKSSDLLGGKMILLKLGPNQVVFPSGADIKATTEKSITEELEERAKPVLENVDSTITKVRGFIDADDKASFKAIVKNFEVTSATIKKMTQESRNHTNQMAGNLISLSAQLRDTEKKLGPLIEQMREFGDSLNELDFANTLRMVNNSVQSIDSLTTKINSGDGTIGLLLNDRVLYDSLNAAISQTKELVEHFDEHPNFYLAPLGKKLKKKDPHYPCPYQKP